LYIIGGTQSSKPENLLKVRILRPPRRSSGSSASRSPKATKTLDVKNRKSQSSIRKRETDNPPWEREKEERGSDRKWGNSCQRQAALSKKLVKEKKDSEVVRKKEVTWKRGQTEKEAAATPHRFLHSRAA